MPAGLFIHTSVLPVHASVRPVRVPVVANLRCGVLVAAHSCACMCLQYCSYVLALGSSHSSVPVCACVLAFW